MNEKIKLRRPRKLKAFTLLEMIVVMAIIGVLASIIIPTTIDRIRSSKIESANTMAEEIFKAAQNYCTDMQIKGVELIQDKEASKTPAFPGKTPTSRKVGVIFTVNSSENWTASLCNCSALETEDQNIKNKCVYGMSNYLGSTTMENLVGTSFYVQFDIDTYTVEYVLYCEQDDESTAENESYKYIEGMVKGGVVYTQVFGRPDTSVKNAKSQEYDTNQFLDGKATSANVVPYVGQYPIK
ncbi:MAG: type II secretion system protein [Oscillospiraceae bacterium]